METLTQKSRRREKAQLAIALLKVAIIKACNENRWRDGEFRSIRSSSQDVDIDLERLEKSTNNTEAEKAIFQETRSRVADVRAYLEGRPIDMSSVDDLGWVKKLERVFETQIGQGQEAGEASIVQKSGPSTKSAVNEGNKDDGFESQRLYGGSGGLPKD